MIDPFWTQVLVAVPATLGSCAAFVYAVRSHGQSVKNTEVLKDVVRQTDGLKTELVAAVKSAALAQGKEQGIAQEKAEDKTKP